MALGIVGAYGGLTKKEISDCLFVGELSPDGDVPGALPIAIEARGRKILRTIVPEANAKEAAMVGGVDIKSVPVRRNSSASPHPGKSSTVTPRCPSATSVLSVNFP